MKIISSIYVYPMVIIFCVKFIHIIRFSRFDIYSGSFLGCSEWLIFENITLLK